MTLAQFVFSTKGRMTRKTYGAFIAVVLVVSLLPMLFGKIDLLNAPTAVQASLIYFSVILFWAKISATTKRLHDLNMSGWWQVLLPVYLALSFGGIALSKNPATLTVSIAPLMLSLIFGFWYLWILTKVLLFSGKEADNRYGKRQYFEELDIFRKEPSKEKTPQADLSGTSVEAKQPSRKPRIVTQAVSAS